MADTKHTPVTDTAKHAFRDAYEQAITDLETVEGANLDTTAKLEGAVKGMATILKKILRALEKKI